MKSFILYIRYISLLIFSGLILPFYNYTPSVINKTETFIHSTLKRSNDHDKQNIVPYSFFEDVLGVFVPSLKK